MIFDRELSDTIMNVVGAFMWVSVGATALHYWSGYMPDHDQVVVVQERTVSKALSIRILRFLSTKSQL